MRAGNNRGPVFHTDPDTVLYFGPHPRSSACCQNDCCYKFFSFISFIFLRVSDSELRLDPARALFLPDIHNMQPLRS